MSKFGQTVKVRGGAGAAGEGWWAWGDNYTMIPWGWTWKAQSYYFAVWCDGEPTVTPTGFYIDVKAAGTSAWFVRAIWDGVTAEGDLFIQFSPPVVLGEGTGIVVHEIDPSIGTWNQTST